MARRLLQISVFVVALFMVVPYLIPLPGGEGLRPEEVAPEQGRFLVVDGVRTFIVEAGPEDGPPVVLVHGFGGSTFSWRYTQPALAAAGYRSVALDLVGFGLSDKRYDADYTHSAQAAFTARVMDELGLPRATLVGHSLGGNVVAHLALSEPERINALVIVDGAVVLPGDPGFGRGGWLVRFGPARRWMRLSMRWVLSRERITSALRTAVADPSFITSAVIDGYWRAQRIDDWDLALLGMVRDASQNALPESPAAIDLPTLLIWGEADTWVSVNQGRRLDELLPRSELVVLAEAGHLPMEERPVAFNAQLTGFMTHRR